MWGIAAAGWAGLALAHGGTGYERLVAAVFVICTTPMAGHVSWVVHRIDRMHAVHLEIAAGQNVTMQQTLDAVRETRPQGLYLVPDQAADAGDGSRSSGVYPRR